MNKEKKYQQRITKAKYFIDKYNLEGIHYPSGKKELEKIWGRYSYDCSQCFCAKKETVYPP